MPAGISCQYDSEGQETADLMYNSWPRRPGAEPHKHEFNTTNTSYGVNVGCHAGQSYKEPDFAAGKSKRISAGYIKTGVLSNRVEEGFRDTKGKATLTETPADFRGNNADFAYGTMRQSLREQRHLPMTGSMVLHGIERPRQPSPSRSMRSGRSGASGRSNRSQQSQVRSIRSQPSNASRRSQTSSQSRASHASRAPSWFEDRSQQSGWNFEPLPMYERTNESYGRASKPQGKTFRGLDHTRSVAAGKSESGWLEPDQLIKTLTRPSPNGNY